jgi:hypothetical protein
LVVLHQTGDLREEVDVFEFGFTRPGRAPTAREQADSARRAPYSPSVSRKWRERREVPDELLDEPTAIELARLEQQRQPSDLIGRVAA